MFDCQKFMDRMGWTQKDLATRLDCSQSKIAMWNTGRASPRYAELLNLIDLGMNIDEMFGDEYAEKLKAQIDPVVKGIDYNSPEFQKGVQEAIMAALASRKP